MPSLAKENEPLWEIGLAAGYLYIPEYMGSDEYYSVPLGIPYLIYRGEIFKADREGLRGLIFDTDRVSLDLGFSFGLPVDNDNQARQGMPDLNLTGQVGPRLNWILSAGESKPKVSFHLPVRYTLDTQGNKLGWVSEPSIKIEQRNLGHSGRFSARADLGLLYAGRRYNEYYYSVPTAYATADRPAYNAESGLHSLFLNLSSEFDVNESLKIGAFVRLQTLEPGVVEDSPLVKEQSFLSFGVGIAWSFWHSEARAR